MTLRFELAYLIGFTPWDRGDMKIPRRLRDVIEGPLALRPGRALDLGCGMGRFSIYLAEHGWRVTGVDAVERALQIAQRRAKKRAAKVDFVLGDVTRLDAAGITGPYDFMVDSGCFHGMSDDERLRYGASVTRVAAADAQLVMFAFSPRGLFGLGPRGAQRR